MSLVVVPRTELIGEPNRYVKTGSRVAIRCVIRGALEPPSYVIWYFGSEQLFADNQFGWQMRMDEGDSQSTVSQTCYDFRCTRGYWCTKLNFDSRSLP